MCPAQWISATKFVLLSERWKSIQWLVVVDDDAFVKSARTLDILAALNPSTTALNSSVPTVRAHHVLFQLENVRFVQHIYSSCNIPSLFTVVQYKIGANLKIVHTIGARFATECIDVCDMRLISITTRCLCRCFVSHQSGGGAGHFISRGFTDALLQSYPGKSSRSSSTATIW
jgi:hypothetical protein